MLRNNLVGGLLFMIAAATASGAQEPLTIEWKDLVPPEMTRELARKGTILDENIKFGMRYDLAYFPLVEELNRKRIRMPGFALPLEFDGTTVKEFLLVPYLGACIHAPPPLPNQIVQVSSDAGFVNETLFTPVWVTGTLRTDGGGSVNLEFVDGVEDVQVGYSLVAETIEIIKPGAGVGR